MDRLYVSYEKYRRMIAEKKILHRLVQGVRILTVALACYGWWGVIYPELTMLPSTYEIVYEETEATEAETVQTGPCGRFPMRRSYISEIRQECPTAVSPRRR